MGETLLMRQAGEPSVEEILESIKKVIARDTRADAAQQVAQRERVQRPEKSRQPEPEPVLELTEAEPEGHDELDDDFDEETVEMPHSDAEPAAGEDGSTEPLVAESAVTSMRDSLAALALLSQPGAAPQIVRSGETSLEGLTRDLLRPMLAQWLEANLPAMVERMVAAEIARIARKKS